jgi:hypothetical protein
MVRAAIVVCLAWTAACGSVGNSLPKGDAGTGGGVGQGTGGASAGTGGAGSGVDAAAAAGGAGGAAAGTGGAGGTAGAGAGAAMDAGGDRMAVDARVDAGPPPVSCQAIKQQNPAATSGVYTIAPIGTAQNVFCEMISGGGGWTAFYVGDNGTTPGDAHFETAADVCPDPANSCLRRLPSTVDETREFAVKCGASVVKFNLDAMAIDYLRNGLEHGWRPLTNALTIDLGIVGKANLVVNMWTGGTVANYGWIISGIDAPSSTPAARATTFGNGYTPNTNWNYCNGSEETVPGSRVMLLYR